MTAIRLDDTPRARGGGRLRPPPRWRRWSLIDLGRRRLLTDLVEARTSARDLGDLAVVELLSGPIEALTALVEHPDPEPANPSLADVLGDVLRP
jgi:hypothetical protein